MSNQDIINEVTETFAREFMTGLQRQASSRIKEDTGSGNKSFDVDFVKGAAGSAAILTTEFASHLRLFDMKKVSRQSQLDPRGIGLLKEWIERKGVSNFMKKYNEPTKVRRKGQLVDVSTTRIINNIAWGISRKKKPLKRKKWYNTKKGGSIYTLYARLMDAVIENSMKEMKENIK
jgi:hypothetical protein